MNEVISSARQWRDSTFGERRPTDTIVVILWELGAMAKSLTLASYQGHGSNKAIAHQAYAQSEAMDVIAQVEALCQDMGWDFDELRVVGAEKFLERMREMNTALTLGSG